MYKELVICIIIIIAILVLNTITENFTHESVSSLTDQLIELKNEITEENIEKDEIKAKVNNIYSNWNDKYNVLAYYIEHNELEKVETNLVLLSSAIETGEYSDVVAKLNEDIFVLRHIHEKNSFDFKNIF